jgi:hypothetical protein
LETILELAIDITILLSAAAIALFVRSRIVDQQQRGLRETAARLGLQFETMHMGRAEGTAAPADEQALVRSRSGATLLNLLARLPMTRSWRVQGRRDGLKLSIEPDAHGHGTPMTRLRADFERPLGLGLELSSRSALDSAPAWLSQPEVKRELEALFDAHAAALIDDRGAQIRLHGRVGDAATLVPLAEALVRAARAVQAADRAL